MGVCMSYAQDSVLRTWFNAGLLPAINFYLFFWLFQGACWILIPGPGMELGPRSECTKSLDHQRIALKFLVTLWADGVPCCLIPVQPLQYYMGSEFRWTYDAP